LALENFLPYLKVMFGAGCNNVLVLLAFVLFFFFSVFSGHDVPAGNREAGIAPILPCHPSWSSFVARLVSHCQPLRVPSS